MKIHHQGTRQNVSHVTNNVGGHLSVTPERKGEPEVKVQPAKKETVKMSAEAENQLDKVGPKGDNKVSASQQQALKGLAEDNKLKKATGDIKETKEDKGLAKASPKFKKVDPKAHASEQDKEKAIEENTVKDDADTDN